MCVEPLLRVRHDPGAFAQMLSFIPTKPCEAGVMMIPHFMEEQPEAQGG